MDEPTDAYRELFEHSPDAILIIEEERFVDCNPAAAEMLRYPTKQALLDRYSGGGVEGSLRAHPGEFSPPTQSDGRDSFEKAEEMMAIALEQGSHRFEWDHLRADGEIFPVEVMLTVVDRGPKRVLHVVWREIGDRKKLEEGLRQAHRLEAVGRLAGGIAHDFNNLLVVILSHAELLRAELTAAGLPAQAARAGEIRAASDRAAALTHQLLTFSRGQPIQPRPTDLVEVLSGLGSLLRRLIGEDIDFHLELPQRAVTVVADPSQIEQLVVNLAANARDAMPEGGRLEVALSLRRHEPSSALPQLPAGDYAAIQVNDTGEGMSEEQLERAFDPFYSTKAPGSGSGLGLATVRSISEQCDGGAYIESAPGRGTSVSILLPLTSAPPVTSESRSPAALSLDGTETILIAEDEKAIRELIRDVLERRGYRVLSASDGAAAAELASKHEPPIDLVISDVVMPRLSGPDLVKRLLESRPDLKVIFMSGYAKEGALSRATVGDAVEILEKPFSPQALLSIVRKLLNSG